MRIKVTFRVLQPNSLLPLSYQYELSSWIYKVIEKSDSGFSAFLHQQGYVAKDKRFKFFTFSNLEVNNYRIVALKGEALKALKALKNLKGEDPKDRMLIRSREISLVLSFLVDKAAEHLIMGLFKDQELRIGDKFSGVPLRVATVEMLKIPEFHSKMRLRTQSPLLVSKPQEDNPSMHDYLHPADADYSDYFLRNLLDKQKAAFEHNLFGGKLFAPSFSFRLLSERPKSRLIKIKAHTAAETEIRGYLFDFELEADPALLRLGYLGGFGGENAMGFGCVELLSENAN